MKYFYGVNPSEKRSKILSSAPAAPFVKQVIQDADTAIAEPSIAFKMSDYRLYAETGNRCIFERPYFLRRNRCFAIAIAYWLTEDEKYLAPLVDYIFYICDEFSWCLPAHTNLAAQPDSEGIIEAVDLFQAETARLFAEIVMCLGDKLPEYAVDRMRYEVRRRILSPFKKGASYWWENCKMNWATVCGAGCAMSLLYFGTQDEKDEYIPRFQKCLDSYLEGIEDDGCCQEGASYWSYGFGHFVILAEAINVYSDGKYDYFSNPKTKAIALYLQKIRMSNSKVVSFSDGGEVFTFKIGLISFLKSKYPEFCLPELDYGNYRGNVYSMAEFLWFDENYVADQIPCVANYFENTQWYIKQTPKFSFAAKGGYNDEPHNHNDIGSFMITVGDETVLADLGCGEYVKETFLPETRYNFIQNHSGGHSVPIINGEYQLTGAQYRATNVNAGDNFFELDIEGAYTPGAANKIHRRFDISESRVTLCDTVDYSADTQSVRERIISKIKPELCDGYIDYGTAILRYDSSRYTSELSTDTYTAHNGIDTVTVYMVDFIPENEREKEFTFGFELK